MKCLAINTATKMLSIAVVEDSKALYTYEKPEARDQGNTLVSTIKQALRELKLEFSDIDLMAVVTGPGSFTGIRVGVAAMRAIALAAKKPLVGVSSFEMFSSPCSGAINITAIESWREELYFSVFDESGSELFEPRNETVEEFSEYIKSQGLAEGKLIISGDAQEALIEVFKNAEFVEYEANAKDVAFKAIDIFNRKKNQSRDKVSPYYLREVDVTISSKPQKELI